MTNFEHIKNMDIESFAMLLAMDRKRTVEYVLESFNIDYKLSKDFLAKDVSALMKYLESERDANVGLQNRYHRN